MYIKSSHKKVNAIYTFMLYNNNYIDNIGGILFSLAVCITNTVVAFAAEQDTPQTKITIKVAEPVKLVIKVANQDGNEETYDVVPTDDSSCMQEIVSDNVVLQTSFEEGEEQKKDDTATVSSQENDTSEPVSDEIQEIDDAQ